MGNRFLRRRPSPATLIALVALFVSLGGAAYALQTNSVKSKHIKNSQVKPSDINKSAEAAWIFVEDGEPAGEFRRADGSPGVRVTRIDPGFYRVRFPFSVRHRALLATPTDYQSYRRHVSVFRCGGGSFDANCPSPHPNDARTVLVNTVEDSGGAFQDTSFWLVAIP